MFPQALTLLITSTLLGTANAAAKESNLLEFQNLGFSGTYWDVSKMTDIYSDECSCERSSSTTSFSGTNAPLNEELSVHFRGPLTLNKFAYYVSSDFSIDSDNSDDWKRLAYYDAEEQTAENVTFLTRAGKNSTCLGKALTFADSDGTSKASDSTILAQDALIRSEEEYVIFSNLTCGKSGLDNDCGVYRDGIPAYHGFYGTVKMFLFEFTMPEEDKVEEGSVYNWNMPAIWLLNSHIPRTSQYNTNSNCSCWASGCGEFDIFEVKNYTDDEVSKLYSTIHDYQGTGLIQEGIQIDGYFERDYTGTMKGGCFFDNDGNAVVFMSNSTSFDETISASDLKSLVDSLGSDVTYQLSDVVEASSSADSESSSSSKDGSTNKVANLSTLILSIFTFLLF